MANAIIMPKTGMAMEEGVIVQWLMKEGDPIEKGDPVVEIETDKSTMEVEADYDGVLLKILYEEGTTVPVVKPIAFIGEKGEDISALAAQAEADGNGAAADVKEEAPVQAGSAAEAAVFAAGETAPAAQVVMEGDRVKATPAARRLAEEKRLSLGGLTPSGRYGEVREKDVAAGAAASKASPLAGRIAADRGIDLSGVAGSGPGGKVMKGDLSAIPAGPQSGASAPQDSRVKLTQIQKITGRRMLQSHLEIPRSPKISGPTSPRCSPSGAVSMKLWRIRSPSTTSSS